MGHGVWMRGTDRDRAAGRRVARWWLAIAVVAVAGAIAWSSASVGTAIEFVAVLGLLLGAGIAFGATDRRPRPGSGLAPPGRRPRDERVAAEAAAVLGSFDRIEHRRLEVGTPWPQLLVGPSGATVVELCPVDDVVEVDSSGVRDRGRGGGRPCSSCQDALQLATTVREALDERGIELPVRTVAVVAEGTEIVIAPDALDEVGVVSVDRLADALARGPVMPMGTVDAAFERLTQVVASDRSPVEP